MLCAIFTDTILDHVVNGLEWFLTPLLELVRTSSYDDTLFEGVGILEGEYMSLGNISHVNPFSDK